MLKSHTASNSDGLKAMAGIVVVELLKKSPYGAAFVILAELADRRHRARLRSAGRRGLVPATSELRRNLDEVCGIDGTLLVYGVDYFYYSIATGRNGISGLAGTDDGSMHLIDVTIGSTPASYVVRFNGVVGQMNSSVVAESLHKRDGAIIGGAEQFARFLHEIKRRQGRATGEFNWQERRRRMYENIEELLRDSEEMRRRNPML